MIKRFFYRAQHALWSLNKWLMDDDDRHTYFVCAVILAVALAFGVSAKRSDYQAAHMSNSAARG